MSATTDNDAILRVLGDAFAAPVRITRVQSLSGGASAETCALDITDGNGQTHELILRRSAGSNHFNPGVGKREEALTQRAAGAAGVAVAQVFAMFDNDAALGSGYVMQRLAGETIPRKLLRDERFAVARTQLARDCGVALANIHRVPVASLPPLPALPPEKQLLQLEGMHRAFGQSVPVFTLAIRWLRERLPPAAALTLVHGDFRNGNFLVDEKGLVAVLDWELVHLGHPLEDLGWLCAPAWRFGGEGAAGGFATRAQLFAAYEQAGGATVDPLQARFWEVFATLRWGVICQFQAFAHLNGMARSVERAAVGRRVTEVELDLLLLMDGKL